MIHSVDLPPEFVERLRQILPANARDSTLSALAENGLTTVRINTLATSLEQANNALDSLQWQIPPDFPLRDSALPFSDAVFQIHRNDRQLITHSPLTDAGWFYPQNLSSILSVAVLNPQPGETILDLAAAPGGKTTAIAQLMQNQGILSAVEPIRNRMFKLKSNLQRCGVSICKTYPIDGRLVGKKTPARFDRVLLDAPCSAEARIRQGQPETWENWSLRKIREQSRKQRGLLSAAVQAVKPGGLVLYCTCSFAPEENEAIVDYVINKFGNGIAIQPISLDLKNLADGLTSFDDQSFAADVQRCVRVLPTEKMDGFFMAKIRRL